MFHAAVYGCVNARVWDYELLLAIDDTLIVHVAMVKTPAVITT
jgi:hypothetical protein